MGEWKLPRRGVKGTKAGGRPSPPLAVPVSGRAGGFSSVPSTWASPVGVKILFSVVKPAVGKNGLDAGHRGRAQRREGPREQRAELAQTA